MTMKLSKALFVLGIFLLASSGFAGLLAPGPATGRADTSWQAKVEPSLLDEFQQAPGEQFEFLIFLTEQADLSLARQLSTKEEKGEFVSSMLRAVSTRTQRSLLDELSRQGVPHRSFWVANMVWAKGDIQLIQSVASRPEVSQVYANTLMQLSLPLPEAKPQAFPDGAAVEWNISLTGAPQVWDAGFTGEGVVLGGQDTGYAWSHPALISQYRGWNGEDADHNYSWHDAIHSLYQPGENPCGVDSPFPCDDNNHGTHTMGTMVGNDGLLNIIGMAPGAKWIGCRNMERGFGTPATYSECFEWFIAPYPVGGSPLEGDPARAPHVINNSWACTTSEGCVAPEILLAVTESVRAAGIVIVASAGNEGSLCSTVINPVGIYGSVFSVGATDSLDNIAGFSSRGPVLVDGSGRLKPDISAPGVSIRSSLRQGGYGYMSGTSMAAPHVAGLVALLISAEPDLAGHVDGIEEIIRASAVPRTTAQECGSVSGTSIPNNTYGWGRISAAAALDRIAIPPLVLEKTAPSGTAAPGELVNYILDVHSQTVALVLSSVVITDPLPAGTVFVTATQPYRIADGVISWDIGQLLPGEHRSFELSVLPDPEILHDYVVNEAYQAVSNETWRPATGPPVSVFVGFRPDIAFGPERLLVTTPVSSLVFTHTLTNTGNITGTFTLQGSNEVGWEMDYPPQVVLAPGESVTIDFSVFVPPLVGNDLFVSTFFLLEVKVEEIPGLTALVVNWVNIIPYRNFLPILQHHSPVPSEFTRGIGAVGSP
jgi:serine protease AprX